MGICPMVVLWAGRGYGGIEITQGFHLETEWSDFLGVIETNTNIICIININEYEYKYYSKNIFQQIRIRILFVNRTIRII